MNRLAKYIIAIAAAAVVIFLVWYFSDIVVYILVSAVLAVMGKPLVDFLCKLHIRKRRFPKWLAAFVTLVAIWGVAVVFFSLFIPLITSKLSALSHLDFKGLLDSFQEPLAKFESFLQTYLSIDTSQSSFAETIERQISGALNLNKINNIVSSIVSVVVNTGIAIFSITFITYFFLKEDNLFTNMIKAVFPSKYEENIDRALNSVTYLLSRYFVGILTESVLMMLLISCGLMICGFGPSNAFFVGVLVGVLNVIPYIGSWIGFGISAFACSTITIGSLTMSGVIITIACTIFCAKMVDDFIFQPFIYSKQVKAHPLEIFIVILIAGSIAGVIGMLLAIPAYTVIRVFAREFFNNWKLVQKLTENLPPADKVIQHEHERAKHTQTE